MLLGGRVLGGRGVAFCCEGVMVVGELVLTQSSLEEVVMVVYG